MAKATVTIVNKLGLHARPSAALTQCAAKFKSEFWITRKTRRVNGKSIMGVMMLAAAKGSELELDVSGPDEVEAMAAISALISSGFGENPE